MAARRAGRPLSEGPAPDPSCFNEKDYGDFRDMMGAERVGQWLARFDEQLDAIFLQCRESTLQQLAQSAHALISQASLLGFAELAGLCTHLEQACHLGGDVTASFREAKQSAEQARQTIARLSAEQPG